MPPLKFICPVTGNPVVTDIDLNDRDVAALNDNTELSCPYCPQPHRIDEIQGWLRGTEPELE
jgi:hypothetical protein